MYYFKTCRFQIQHVQTKTPHPHTRQPRYISTFFCLTHLDTMARDVPPIIPCYQQVLAIVGSEIMSNQININHPIFRWTVPSLSNKNSIRWFPEFPGFITSYDLSSSKWRFPIHAGTPKSSKSLNHLVLKAMVTWGSSMTKKPLNAVCLSLRLLDQQHPPCRQPQ